MKESSMRAIRRLLIPLTISVVLAGCGGGGNGKSQQVQLPDPPAAPVVTVGADIKQLIFDWGAIADATHYRLLENLDGHSGFTQVGNNIPASELSVTKNVAVHLHDWVNALYLVQACNAVGCTDSTQVRATDLMLETILTIDGTKDPHLSGDGRTMAATGVNGTYILRNDGQDWAIAESIGDVCPAEQISVFRTMALSKDGNTLAVSCPTHLPVPLSNVFIFRFDGTSWSESSIIGGADHLGEFFGSSVALSANGNTLVAGAKYADNDPIEYAPGKFTYGNGSGAAYVYRFKGTAWVQDARLTAPFSNPRGLWYGLHFGAAVALSDDGSNLAVGARGDSSSSSGIGGPEEDACDWDNARSFYELYSSECWPFTGAVHVFKFEGSTWSRQTYIKASNAGGRDEFGVALDLGGDGSSLAVGAPGEDSGGTGINGDQNNYGCNSGAAYVFEFDGATWSQQAYVKPSNTKYTGGCDVFIEDTGDYFGESLALSNSGRTLAVGSPGEDGDADGVGGDESANGDQESLWFEAGAVYVYQLDTAGWTQRAYVKDPDSGRHEAFGWKLSLGADGEILAVMGQRYDESDKKYIHQLFIY